MQLTISLVGSFIISLGSFTVGPFLNTFILWLYYDKKFDLLSPLISFMKWGGNNSFEAIELPVLAGVIIGLFTLLLGNTVSIKLYGVLFVSIVIAAVIAYLSTAININSQSLAQGFLLLEVLVKAVSCFVSMSLVFWSIFIIKKFF